MVILASVEIIFHKRSGHVAKPNAHGNGEA
jgi:hypothetical protein